MGDGDTEMGSQRGCKTAEEDMEVTFALTLSAEGGLQEVTSLLTCTLSSWLWGQADAPRHRSAPTLTLYFHLASDLLFVCSRISSLSTSFCVWTVSLLGTLRTLFGVCKQSSHDPKVEKKGSELGFRQQRRHTAHPSIPSSAHVSVCSLSLPSLVHPPTHLPLPVYPLPIS